MSMNRYDAKRDRNEKAIVEGLKAIGAKVLRLPNPDLLVLYRDCLYLIEIKTKGGRSTRSQITLAEEGWPIHIARSLPEALAVVMGRGSPDGDPDSILKGLGSLHERE